MDDHAPICVTCGTQFPPTAEPPSGCPICEDERQYVGHGGQRWTSLAELREGRRNLVREIAPNLSTVSTEPSFAIGQQAHLICTSAGNLLWDCVSLLDHETVAAVERLGGVAAIAISHPHFYTAMVEWARAFDAPVFLHGDDRRWVMHRDPGVLHWGGQTLDPLPGSGLTLIRCGGHFPGSCVLHWPAGAGGRGVLLTGDTISVVADRRWVSFMWSYPNQVPLDPAAVERIVTAIEPYPFDVLYAGWAGDVVDGDAQGAVRRSAARYVAHLRGEAPAAG